MGHIVVEGIAVGAVPIVNNTNLGWTPALEHGKNCLSFNNEDELKARINDALKLPTDTIQVMRANVVAYYDEYLRPERFAARLRAKPGPAFTVYVDAEAETARLYKMSSQEGT